MCFSAVCTRAEVVVCSLLLSFRAAFPLVPQFYFSQDHFDMHQMLDLCMQITKGIERLYLILLSLVKPQVLSHSIHSVELAEDLCVSASSVTCICAASHLSDSVQSGDHVSCVPWLLGFRCSWKPAVCPNAAGFRRLLW